VHTIKEPVAGVGPAIHVFRGRGVPGGKAWMPGTSLNKSGQGVLTVASRLVAREPALAQLLNRTPGQDRSPLLLPRPPYRLLDQ